MKLLPPRTQPPDIRLERRHRPVPATGPRGYRIFRPCLRWEFAFTCSFCLLHESDWSSQGIEGLGFTTTEHFLPTGQAPEQINAYENCFYACRLCNGSRRDAPGISPGGQTLLEPFSTAWGERFHLSEEDCLVARDGDDDAAYTLAVYDLNDPRKVARRRERRERLGEWLELLREGPTLVESLLARCTDKRDGEKLPLLLEAARRLQEQIRLAALHIRRFQAIPLDADSACRCGHENHHSLPLWLDRQTLSFEAG